MMHSFFSQSGQKSLKIFEEGNKFKGFLASPKHRYKSDIGIDLYTLYPRKNRLLHYAQKITMWAKCSPMAFFVLYSTVA